MNEAQLKEMGWTPRKDKKGNIYGWSLYLYAKNEDEMLRFSSDDLKVLGALGIKVKNIDFKGDLSDKQKEVLNKW